MVARYARARALLAGKCTWYPQKEWDRVRFCHKSARGQEKGEDAIKFSGRGFLVIFAASKFGLMNNLKIYRNILGIAICFLMAIFAGSCTVSEWEEGFLPGGITGTGSDSGKGNAGDRTHNEDRRKVLLLYSAGYNSLRNYLLEDIEDLKSGWLPKDYPNHDILLVYTHTPKSSSAYGIPTTPYLIRLYEGDDGQPVADTLVTYEAGTHSATAEQFRNVLTYVKNNFPAGNYGMVFSSHATGYLPSGFYNKPESYEYIPKRSMMKQFGLNQGQEFTTAPVPYYAPDYDPSLPLTKSIGQDQVGSAGNYVSYEMELGDFADAFPMKFDYILFDACLMGGIEVAYELRDVCDRIGFSQTEVLAEGLNYKTLTEHLLKNTVPNPQAVCEDYFSQYIKQSGVYQSATISLIDCRELEPLAQVCKNIFTNHRSGIKAIRMSNVQQYYRSNYRYFYDLKSIVQEAGATAQEMAELKDALDKCVIYGAFTPKFMEEFRILTYSGFSMYLPRDLSTAFYFEELNMYYQTLDWNKATGLVR